MHADAWQLSEEGFEEIRTEMTEFDAAVAYKSSTRNFIQRHPPGSVMDQFFVLDAERARSAEVFKRSPLDFPPPISPHETLMAIWVSAFGWNDMYQYSTRQEEEYWDGEPTMDYHSGTGSNPVRPMMYNPEYGQLHIAAEDFSNSLGRQLQASYLRRHDITEGGTVEQFLDDYGISDRQLQRELADYCESVDSRLSRYGLSMESFNRDLRLIEAFLDDDRSTVDRVKKSIRLNTEDTTLWEILSGLQTLVGDTLGDDDEPDCYDSVPVRKGRSEASMNEIYTELLDADDYPSQLRDGTFVDDGDTGDSH
ncbi:hypothetical protein GRX03_06115 [Halovenus sp. WSH3]|uniref:Uncharacterized protein n=1 Tax=Halovenus carboxidivorans TaxID=2692199 RepID=A0A6B0T8K0_9EURY|nr:hypothetical protein [Halovenus carboxidivorans]MXR51180.1 hypothetical protein [Halovenus carboxidivorans]